MKIKLPNNNRSKESHILSVIIIVLVALGLRLTVFTFAFQDPQRMVHEDSGSFIRPALNLINHATLTQMPPEQEFREPSRPYGRGISARVPTDILATRGPYLYDVFRTPGYPIFLSVVFGLFGYTPLAATFLQCMISVLTCLLVYFIGVSVGGSRFGFWGGLLAACDPGSIIYCNQILSETCFSFLITASLLFLIQHRRNILRDYAYAGCMLGLAILVRPAGLYLLPGLAIIACLTHDGSYGRKLKASVIIIATSLAFLFPWLYRNYHHFGVWSLSNIQGLNIVYYKAVALEAEAPFDDEDLGAARQRLEREFETTIQRQRLNYLEMAHAYQKFGMKRIKSEPTRYAVLHLRGTLAQFLSHHVGDLYKICGLDYRKTGLLSRIIHRKGNSKKVPSFDLSLLLQVSISVAELVVNLLLFGLAAVGSISVLGCAHSRTAGFYLIITALYFSLLSGPQTQAARLLFPAISAFEVLAAGGIMGLCSGFGKTNRPNFRKRH